LARKLADRLSGTAKIKPPVRNVDFLCLFGIRNTQLAGTTNLFLTSFLLAVAHLCHPIPEIEDDICHARRVMDGTGASVVVPRRCNH
jgi:hypothetical protein